MKRREFIAFGVLATGASLFASSIKEPVCVAPWYMPASFPDSPNNVTLHVRDTDSALGRYNSSDCVKEITMQDLVKFHGHLCDGLVFSYLQLAVGLQKLFPDGIIDRTDLRGACKNSPCMVDALAYLTGSKINFKTLRIDPTLGASHIIQKISTGETYSVKLAKGYFPDALKESESQIRSKVGKGDKVAPSEIDRVEKLANSFIEKMLHTPLEKLVDCQKIEGYQFVANIDVSNFGNRGDVVNKYVPKK